MFSFKPNVEKLRASRNFDGLIRALRYQKDHRVQEAAVEALAAIGDAQAVGPLVTVLRGDTGRVRDAAALALDLLGGAEATAALSEHLANEHKFDQAEVCARCGASRTAAEAFKSPCKLPGQEDRRLSEAEKQARVNASVEASLARVCALCKRNDAELYIYGLVERGSGKAHVDRLRWCPSCQKYWCGRCAKKRMEGIFTNYFCPKCDADAT